MKHYIYIGIIVGAVKQFESVLSLDKTHRLAFAGICRCLRIMGQLSRLNLFTSRYITKKRRTECDYLNFKKCPFSLSVGNFGFE